MTAPAGRPTPPNLPPLLPWVEGSPLAERILRLGAAGFPLVLPGQTVLDTAEGGWPITAIEGQAVARLDRAQLQEQGARLRIQGIAPIVLGATLTEASACFAAGAESLLVGDEVTESAAPGELLWQAQLLRWRARPPLQRGQGVALIGGSGCGKSVLAVRLAARLGLPPLDLDAVVAARAGKSIPRIFAEDGEPWFRRLEADVTCEAFHSPAVLALGGGAWESEAVRSAARASSCAVLWIAEVPGLVWARVARDPARPLAQDRASFLARWRARMPRWREAPMILPLGRTPEQLAAALARTLTALDEVPCADR